MVIHPTELPKISIGTGVKSVLRSFSYLFKHPDLFKYILPIFLINGLLVGGLLWLIWIGASYIDSSLAQWASYASETFLESLWYGFLQIVSLSYTILKWVMFAFILIFIAPSLFSILLTLNPITYSLAYQIYKKVFEQELGISLPGKEQGGGISFMASLMTEIRKAMVFLLLSLLLLILGLVIPYVGSLFSAVALFILSIQTTGWALLSIYYESLGYSYTLQRKAMHQHRFALWGLGSIRQIFLLVPILNIMSIFIETIAGALFATEIQRKLLSK